MIKVSLSFAEENIDIADKIATGLMGKGISVVSNSKKLSNNIPNWGKHLFDIIDADYSPDVHYCIVLITPEYHQSKWNKYNKCKLLENAYQREDFILPVKIGTKVNDIPGLSLTSALEIEQDDLHIIIDAFLQKTGNQERKIDLLKGYQDIEDIIRLYDSKVDLEKKSSPEDIDKEKKIGFDLYASKNRLLGKIDYYVLYLYQGITIKNTYEYIYNNYKEIFHPSKYLLIIIPQKTGQGDSEKSLDYIQTTFNKAGTGNTIIIKYLKDFIWEFCTSKEFKELKSDLPLSVNFVVPNIIDTHNNKEINAEEFIVSWLNQDDNPLLVMKGTGGIGKTTLAKWVSNYFEKKMTNTVSIYIDSAEITSTLRRSMETNNELDLYKFYEADFEERQIKSGASRKHKLDKLEFKCNVDNGNIILIIDGFDEILTSFDKQFDINSFLSSIHTFSSDIGYGKVIITSRDYFWDKYELHNVIDFQLIEVCPFDEQLAKKYFSNCFPNMPKFVEKAFEILNLLMLSKKEKNYPPFVLDLVSYVVKEQYDSKAIADSRFNSELLCNSISTDYLLFKICDREVIRLEKTLEVDEQIQLFMKLATQYNLRLDNEKLAEEIQAISKGKSTEKTVEAIKAHPLLTFFKDKNEVRFKYDLFEEHFKNIYLGIVLRGMEKVGYDHISILSDHGIFDSLFHRNLIERLKHMDVTDQQSYIIDCISAIQLMDNKKLTIEVKNRALSSLLLLSINAMYGIGSSLENNTGIVKELFLSGGKIQNMAIINCNSINSPRIVFDFSDLHLYKCTFTNFSYFNECKFNDATRFENCRFENLSLNHKSKASLKTHMFINPEGDANFKDYLKVAVKERGNTKQEVTEDFVSFLRIFYRNGQILNMNKPYILKQYHEKVVPLDKMIKVLCSEGIFFDYLSDSKELKYDVQKEYRYAIINYLNNGTTTPELEKALQRLLKNYL